MSSHLVHGVPLPDAVGGHPALDFCNTRAGWGSARPKEYLTSPGALALWAADAGLAPWPEADPDGEADADADALRDALALREALYRCALGTAADGAARWVLALDRNDPAGADPARLALHAVATAAEQLVTSSLLACVRACPGVGCGWLFADPRRRRRWCSMAVCGNRAKARRHAERRQAPSISDHTHSNGD